MSEQEYINVKELGHITCAKYSLNDIVPENSIVVKKTDYDLVMKILLEWEIELYKIIKTT